MATPKKSLGQHFLRDTHYARRIADAVVGDSGNVAEIGPGQGMLTQFLLGRFTTLLLVEKDTALADSAEEAWGNESSVFVRESDVLRFDFIAFWNGRPFSLVGNYPYNISSQIVFLMLDLRDQIPEMVGMFQLEMAKRIVSGPGTKDYGILSVLTAAYYSRKMLFTVPPGAFYPPPKVNSAVIRLTRNQDEVPCAYQTLRSVVKLAFGQRRKMLRNSLKGLFGDETMLEDPFFTRRPEQVEIAEFIDLACQLETLRNQ